MKILFTILILLATAGYGNARPVRIQLTPTHTIVMSTQQARRVVRTTHNHKLRSAIQLRMGIVNLGKEFQLGRCHEASNRQEQSQRRWEREPSNVDCGQYNGRRVSQ